MAASKPRKDKTKRMLVNQTQAQNDQSSEDIRAMTDGLMKTIIDMKIITHGELLLRRLGMSSDDIKNELRIELWKAKVTYDPSKGATLKTYAENLVNNRIALLLHRTKYLKFAMVDYYSDALPSEEQESVSEETAETMFEKRSEYLANLKNLNGIDQVIYMDLTLGCSIHEMMFKNKMSRVAVISAINKIADAVKNRPGKL